MSFRRNLIRIFTACAVLALSPLASAYYHWTYFTAHSGPFVAKRLRFDLNALPDSTVSFFIQRSGPSKMVDGDNFAALVSQIRRAGETWNVSGSALKVKFGGFQDKPFTDILAEQVTPGIDVVFDDDLPPGVLAYSEPFTYTDLSYLGAANAPGFVPLLRSRLQLAADLAARSQASYSDAFFLTIVHEFGHTLGLQHSMTSGAMATSYTRGTSKAVPLAADDIAGLAALYPTEAHKASTGAIAGNVSVLRNPANLASVVALSMDGRAIGAMTGPDGSYIIEGLPPGDYLLYAHPLPPAQAGEVEPAGIVLPKDLAQAAFPAIADFQTRFYPAAKDWHEATRIKVEAGKTAAGIDFALNAAAGNRIYNLSMFGYLGPQQDVPAHAPPLPVGYNYWLSFQAPGTQVPGGTAMVPGLQLSAISEAAVFNPESLRNYPDSDRFLLIAVTALAVNRTTPVAVAVTTDDNLYVLPGAFRVAPSRHPSISGVTAAQDGQGNPAALIAGDNLIAGTQVLFDGAGALSVKVNDDGTLLAVAPPASGQHQAVVELLGADGQTSWELQGGLPPQRFAYDAPAEPFAYPTVSGAIAGTSAMVEIQAVGTKFLAGKTSVGFGTSDVTVRQIWVTGPERLLMNVTVHPGAKPGDVPMTVLTGSQITVQGAALQVRPAAQGQPSLLLPIVNQATGFAATPAGGTLAMQAAGIPDDVRNWTAVVGGERTVVSRAPDGRLLAQVPPSLPVGPQALQLIPPSGPPVPPVLFQVDYPAPRIAEINGGIAGGFALAQVAPLKVNERMTLLVSNLASDTVPPKEEVEVRVAGVPQRVDVLEPAAPGTYKIEFLLSSLTPAGEAELVVAVGTRVSAGVPVSVALHDAP